MGVFVWPTLNKDMIPSLEITAGPASEPISLIEVKAQIRVDNSEEDALLTTYISAARLAFERLTHGHTLIATTFVEHVPDWGDECRMRWYHPNSTGWHPLRLSRGKVSSISSITYYDADDVSQTLTGHTTDITATPALVRMQTAPWPVLSCKRIRPITVTYVAGYASAGAVPQDIKVALLSLVAHWYWGREAYAESEMKSVPMQFEDFCSIHSTGLGGL